jgi:hypothetical protein
VEIAAQIEIAILAWWRRCSLSLRWSG